MTILSFNNITFGVFSLLSRKKTSLWKTYFEEVIPTRAVSPSMARTGQKTQPCIYSN